MNYFGAPWPSIVCEDGTQIPTPVGMECAWCSVPIEDGDQGVVIPAIRAAGEVTLDPWHKECFLRSTVGSPAHLAGRCSCQGGQEGPGPQTPAERLAEAREVWMRMMAGNN